jgi:hypothetical protein
MQIMTLTTLCVWMMVAGSPKVFDTKALIEQALDEPTKITLENVKLGSAIQIVTDQTGVRVFMSPQVMNLVPQGADTRIEKVDIARVPLREGLTRLFAPLGMNWVVRSDGVEVVPKEAIACLGRPPTWTELQVLAELCAVELGLDEAALKRLQAKVQFQVPEINATWLGLSTAIRSVGAGPGDEVLTAACNKLGWGWCLSGDRILITSAQELLRRRLAQPISLRINNRPLLDVFGAITHLSGVPVRVEPGVIDKLPLDVQRNFSLNVQQQSIEQALDNIAGYAGLGYVVTAEGVLFYRPDVGNGPPVSGAAGSPAGFSDPVVGKVVKSLPDGRTIEWVIRASELPEDLRQMRQRDIQDAIDALRRQDSQTTQTP